ncbi:MAG: extracellular solute-binding protein [Clostridiales bacterium]|nr:extracellular solute-binding protein [Clostridiales bacterium]
MKKKRIVSCMLVAVMAVGLMSGCGSSTASDSDEEGSVASTESTAAGDSTASGDEQIELTVFHRFSDGASKEFFDEVAEAYMEEHPNVTITMTSADNENYKSEISVKLASNDAPDIYFAWSGVYAENFADGGRVLDLTSYIEEDTEWSDGIFENQWGPFTFDDSIYGVPIIMDGKAFYYNVEIFDELGLEVPETWDEFIDVLEALSETDYIPISLGNVDDWATGHYMTTLNQRMVDADTLAADYALEGDFSDPQYVAALEKLEELIPYFTPDCNATSYDTGISDFITGKAAIYYEQFNQEQYIEPAEFEWSWFDMPDITEGDGDQDELTGAPQGFMVSADTEYPDEAVDFLKYLTSQEVAAQMVEETSMLSCVDGAINEDTANEKVVAMAETIKAASNVNLWLDNATDSELVSVYLADIQKMVGGGMTAEEVMADVQATAAELKEE